MSEENCIRHAGGKDMAIETTKGLLETANQSIDKLSLNSNASAAKTENAVKSEEAGQRTDSGPAVVVELSAAARESARPVSATGQTADQNRASSATEPAEEPVSASQNQATPVIEGRDQLKRTPIDVVV